MKFDFPLGTVEIHEAAPTTTRLSPLVAHHLSGIRTALALGTSGQVRADVAMQHAAAELEKLAGLLAGGECYAAEAVVIEPVSPGDLVVLDDIETILADTAGPTAHERDGREVA